MRPCKFSFDAFIKLRKAVGMVPAQAVVYLFYDRSSKQERLWPDDSRVPSNLAM